MLPISTTHVKYFTILPLLCLTIYAMGQSTPEMDKIQMLNTRAYDYLRTNYDSSRRYADSAYALANENDLYPEMVKSLITKGVSYYYSGVHDEATRWYMQALKLADSIGDPKLQAMALNEMGVMNRKNGNLEKAEAILTEALELSQKAGDSATIANSMNNLGVTYDILEKYEMAMKLYQESAEIKRGLDDTYGLTFNLDNMGQTLAKMSRYKEGEAYFLEAAKLRKELGDETGYAITINNIGELYLMKGDLDLALAYFQQALKAAEKLDYKDFRLHLYQVLSETYRKAGDVSVAFDFLSKTVSLKDSIFNEQRNMQIVEMQTKYETEKKEQELKILKAEAELQSVRMRKAQNFIFFLVMLFVLAVSAVFLFHSRKQFKLKALLAEEKKRVQTNRFRAVIDAEEKERKRIARELHDGLGQLLSTVRLTISSLGDEEEDPKIRSSVKLIDAAVQEIRSISHNMMPNALATQGLEVALEDLVRKINLSGRIQVILKKDCSIQLDELKSIAIYRVVQEVFNNAIKYSQAKNMELAIVESNGDLALSITDNGRGFDTTSISNSSGIGWSNVYSRMDLIGGQVSVISKIDIGTTVRLKVPIEASQKSIAS